MYPLGFKLGHWRAFDPHQCYIILNLGCKTGKVSKVEGSDMKCLCKRSRMSVKDYFSKKHIQRKRSLKERLS